MPHPAYCRTHQHSLDPLPPDSRAEEWDCDRCHAAPSTYLLTQVVDRGPTLPESVTGFVLCNGCALAILEEAASGHSSYWDGLPLEDDAPAPHGRSVAA